MGPTRSSSIPEEHTPLLVRAQSQNRSPLGLRSLITRVLGCLLIIVVLAVVAFPDSFLTCQSPYDHGIAWPWACPRRGLGYRELQRILLDTPSSERVEEWSRYYTAGPHLAGKNYSQVVWTKNKWEDFGIQSDIVSYDVYINYPVDHRLTLLKQTKDDKNSNDADATWKVTFEAPLTEDVLEDDPTTSLPDRIPTFHGYSASGNVTGPVVYVNYGTYQDFEDLVRANVSLAGKVAIARYGGIFRGLKVKRAQELGMLGVIIYSDPGDDGEITEEKGKKPYPDGPARNPSSVQRGSVQFLSFAPGDPTTPGYPSKPGVPRQPVHTAIPSIPSVPISYRDALPILRALNGHGPKSAEFGRYWTRNQGLEYKGVDYNIGPTPDDVVVNLYNQQEYVTTPIWNVIGIINGTIPDEVVIIGNHRDAWVAGGAADPNSGSAVLNEVVRSFGEALRRGWKPLRTIVFASWDGEEYGLVGSTEWVEEYLPWLNATNVAYINTDVSARGSRLRVSAAPLLEHAIHAATSAVPSPNQTVPGQTVRDVWDGTIRTMGSGSDFTAFQDYAGVPSVDIGFDVGPGEPVYHYHIIPFRAVDYAKGLDRYIKQVEDKLDKSLSPSAEASSLNKLIEDDDAYFTLRTSTSSSYSNLSSSSSSSSSSTSPHSPDTFRTSLTRLRKALKHFAHRAHHLDRRADHLARHLPGDGDGDGDDDGDKTDDGPWWRRSWWKWWLPHRLLLRGRELRQVNTRYKLLEREFLYEKGLDGRRWFKHVVFAPGLWTGYAGAVFPGLVESIDNKDWTNAVRWAGIIESRIKNAASRL
ncbi:hypothetical protein VTJ49DRAFT_5627 [Mycothermus thermophilus]|uniref:Uncharacterized protein n=1 Tax=Humicola insolens TaxID=85995 RepID=A0ABR3V2P7_HUMIN